MTNNTNRAAEAAQPAATSGDAPELQQLKALALAATPQNFDSWQVKSEGGEMDCPACGGEGTVERGNDYCNYDKAAIGVTFYGIGEDHRNAEAYYRAVRPAVVLDLIARIERAASGATASGDELPSLSDFDYQEILGPVLSREGMRRYRNGDPLNLDPSDLRAMIDRARAAVSAATKPTADLPRPSDDELWDATLRDRDTYHEWADKLAEAISKHFDAYIGEHSNANCPWAEALEVIEGYEDEKPAHFAALLPGPYYMDPPDGGSVSILEQIKRMAEDATQWRSLLATKPAAAPADQMPGE